MPDPVVCPFAKWRPLETAQREPKMTGHDIFCFHTMVGYLVSTDGYFRSGGWDGTESHWGVGGAWGPDLGGRMDGTLFQWQDMLYQADANLNGNPRVLSVETADNAPRSASDLKAWTPAQVDTLVRLGIWVTSKAAHARCPSTWTCHREGIPRVLIPDTKPGRRGLGYHRQGVDPYRVDGGVRWSSAYGKVCPGDARINQLITEVVPRIRAEHVSQEDDMPSAQEVVAEFADELTAGQQTKLRRNMVALINGELDKREWGTRPLLVQAEKGGPVFVLEGDRGGRWQVSGWDNVRALVAFYNVSADGEEAGHPKPWPIPQSVLDAIPETVEPDPAEAS